jgi:hypothetical protein
MYKQPWDEHTQGVIDKVQATIKAVFPEAEFAVHYGEDPEGIYIDAYTTAEDGFHVLDLVNDWLVDLHVEEELGIYVVPIQKPGT